VRSGFGIYDSGLYRLKEGGFTHYTTREGLFDNDVFRIIEDGSGNFWIRCNLGLYRVRKAELNDLAEGRTAKISLQQARWDAQCGVQRRRAASRYQSARRAHLVSHTAGRSRYFKPSMRTAS
jgi:hypothetical protein